MLQSIGIIGGILSLISNVPYVINIFRGKTKPHRVTWGVFFLLNLVFLFNQLAIGANNSLWLIYSFLITSFCVFILSIFYGVGGHSKVDIVVIVGCLLGILLWVVFNNPILSIISNILVALLATIPTVVKSWRQPESETAIKWLLGAIGALFALVSVGGFNQAVYLPAYSFLTQLVIFIVLISSRRR